MMSPAMVELFLRSAGAPPAVLEIFKVAREQGMTAFQMGTIPPDDPRSEMMPSREGVKKNCLWLGAKGPTSRVTALVYLEGIDDAILEKMGLPIQHGPMLIGHGSGRDGSEGRDDGQNPR